MRLLARDWYPYESPESLYRHDGFPEAFSHIPGYFTGKRPARSFPSEFPLGRIENTPGMR